MTDVWRYTVEWESTDMRVLEQFEDTMWERSWKKGRKRCGWMWSRFVFRVEIYALFCVAEYNWLIVILNDGQYILQVLHKLICSIMIMSSQFIFLSLIVNTAMICSLVYYVRVCVCVCVCRILLSKGVNTLLLKLLKLLTH